jgi:O-antigen/teichoic acid export membrane protein
MRRARWAPLADQVLANASNALFTVLVAGVAAPAAFGRFAVGYAIVAFAVGAWRSGLGYQVSMKAGDPEAVRTEARRAVGATAVAAPLLGVVALAVIGIGPAGDPTLAWGLALATPFVLLQDLLRFAAVAAGRAIVALASDAAWTALLVVAVGLRVVGRLDAVTLVALWASGAVVGTVILAVSLRVAPKVSGSLAWARESWRMRIHLVGGGLVAGASVPITAGIVALVAGPEIAGGVAGAALLMAPVNSLVAWLSLTLLARAAVVAEGRKAALFLKAGLGTAALTLLWGLVLLAVPESLGRILLGDTWLFVAQGVPVIGLQYAVAVLAATGTLFLVATGKTRAVLVTGIVVAVARVGFGWIAATIWGTVLAAVLAESLAMAVWTTSVLPNLRSTTRSGTGSQAPEAS